MFIYIYQKKIDKSIRLDKDILVIMSYNPFFSLKATNSNIASFSSTEDETYILLIANDIEKQTENGTIKNSGNSNAILIGANTINNTTDEHELSITVRNNNNSEIIENVLAKFNNNNILFKTDTIFENNSTKTFF